MAVDTLEDKAHKAVEIEINGIKKRVIRIEGNVREVDGYAFPNIKKVNELRSFLSSHQNSKFGYEKVLNIHIEKESEPRHFKFRANAPIERGDNIIAGIVIPEKLEELGIYEAIYVSKLNEKGEVIRTDYVDGYLPTIREVRKLGNEVV